MEERRLNAIKKAAETLEELNEAIEKSESLLEKAQLKMLKASIEAELQEAFGELLAEIIEEHPNEAKELKKQIEKDPRNILGLFDDFLEGLLEGLKNSVADSTGETFIAGLSEEIISIINHPKTAEYTAIEYNPLFSSKANIEAAAGKEPTLNFSTRSGVDYKMVMKEGFLPAYEMAVLDKVIYQYRLGNVTSENEVVFTLDDLCRSIIDKGNTRTPSKKQRDDVRAALYKIRNQERTFLTSNELADLIGVEAAEIADRLEGYKHLKKRESNGNKLYITHFIDKLDIVEDEYEKRGKKTVVIKLTFSDLLQSLLDTFQWYQPLDKNINHVQYIDENGVLKDISATKGNVAILDYIRRNVFAKIRTTAAGKRHSNMINYDTMFKYCEVDVSTSKQKNRRKELVKDIFRDYQRKGYIVSFEEYLDKAGKPAGIKYTTPKFELIEEE